MWRKAVPPKCLDCKSGQCRVITVGSAVRDGVRVPQHAWLCASCEYKRIHPDAATAVPMPWERPPGPVQVETLW